jgi:hypothetical protein
LLSECKAKGTPSPKKAVGKSSSLIFAHRHFHPHFQSSFHCKCRKKISSFHFYLSPVLRTLHR